MLNTQPSTDTFISNKKVQCCAGTDPLILVYRFKNVRERGPGIELPGRDTSALLKMLLLFTCVQILECWGFAKIFTEILIIQSCTGACDAVNQRYFGEDRKLRKVLMWPGIQTLKLKNEMKKFGLCVSPLLHMAPLTSVFTVSINRF